MEQQNEGVRHGAQVVASAVNGWLSLMAGTVGVFSTAYGIYSKDSEGMKFLIFGCIALIVTTIMTAIQNHGFKITKIQIAGAPFKLTNSNRNDPCHLRIMNTGQIRALENVKVELVDVKGETHSNLITFPVILTAKDSSRIINAGTFTDYELFVFNFSNGATQGVPSQIIVAYPDKDNLSRYYGVFNSEKDYRIKIRVSAIGVLKLEKDFNLLFKRIGDSAEFQLNEITS